MKTIKLLLLCFVLTTEINAQGEYKLSTRKYISSAEISTIKFKQDIQLFSPTYFRLEPQFGGLFDASFKHVNGIANVRKFYDNPDLGFKLGLNRKLNEHLNLKALYTIGVLKFNEVDTTKAKSYQLKVALHYIF